MAQYISDIPARHFLDIDDLSIEELNQVLFLAKAHVDQKPLRGSGVVLLFEKPSARTRNSSEMAVWRLGGHPMSVVGGEVGIDERESAEDLALTLACYHAIICARVFSHQVLKRMAAALDRNHVSTPVVNLLSDFAHPCQAIADILTFQEASKTTDLSKKILCYVGDANNMCRSLAKAGLMKGMDVRIASPLEFCFSPEDQRALKDLALRLGNGGSVTFTSDPSAMVFRADFVYTDVWVSMGEQDSLDKKRAFEGFCLDEALVAKASPNAHVLHCLPAHRGEEITAEIFEGSQSRVWMQAANRESAMIGLFTWLNQLRENDQR